MVYVASTPVTTAKFGSVEDGVYAITPVSRAPIMYIEPKREPDCPVFFPTTTPTAFSDSFTVPEFISSTEVTLTSDSYNPSFIDAAVRSVIFSKETAPPVTVVANDAPDVPTALNTKRTNPCPMSIGPVYVTLLNAGLPV
jgi:hypothetical protein